ncbi:hypothetical protein [Pseudomonas sp. McL0111]|uniref:hypothetical protein n=1 Tax=Pseudomonas sp. McL0111 TaxID=3457357 RepID=UPI00403EEAEE
MNTKSSSSSATWLQEFTPYVNGQKVKWPDLALKLGEGEVCTLMLDYEYSWLIGDPDSKICLMFKPGEEIQGMIVDPPLGQLVAMEEGTTSLSWSIRADGLPSDDFVLEFKIPLIVELPTSPPVSGEVFNLTQDLDVMFDVFPMALGKTAYPCHGARHRLTVVPKPASRLLNSKIKLLMIGEDFGVEVTPSLAEEHVLKEDGVSWELYCNSTENGDFSLQVELVEAGIKSSSLIMSLAHNLVTAVRESKQIEPGGPGAEPYTQHLIRATSSFKDIPAHGVKVKVHLNSGAVIDERTRGNGEAAWNDYGNVFNRMSITNPYDGTTV